MSTRINTKVPPPTQANTTKRLSLPTDESQTGVLPLSKTSVNNAEEWKVNNDRNYAMPLHEVEIVIPATVKEENESDESDGDNEYEDDDFEDPNWHLPSNVDHFTRENVKDDTLFEEVSKKDCSTPDSEKKYVFF